MTAPDGYGHGDWTCVAAPDDGEPNLALWRSPWSGRPVLAVHGMEDTWRSWDPLARRLAGRYRFYAADVPWRTGNPYTWRGEGDARQWLGRVLALLPEPVCAVIGHSFGANALLARLAAGAADAAGPAGDSPAGPALPPGARAAVLLAPFYWPDSGEVGGRAEEDARRNFTGIIMAGLRVKLGERRKDLDPEIVEGMARKLAARVVPAGFPVFYEAFVASGRLDLTGVATPTLVLCGTDDELIRAVNAEALAARLPSGDVRRRDTYTHFCHLAQADRVADEVGTFLDRQLAVRTRCEEETTVTVLLDGEPTTYLGEPRHEGANIRTWIGFKQYMNLVEEAVLRYFAERGCDVRAMYHEHRLGLVIVEDSIQLPAAIDYGERIAVTVVSGNPKPGRGAPFTVKLTTERDGGRVTVGKAKVRVALVELKDDGAPAGPVPAMLAPYAVPEIAALARDGDGAPLTVPPGRDVADVLTPAGSGAFLWSWVAPYHWCHLSDRLTHSAYVKAMEDGVDRFLRDRGLAIGELLVTRGWIPVVSRAKVELLADVWMEETVHTRILVEDILKDISWTARMDCYVRRGDQLVHTMTGTIMHGYAVSRGPDAGTVATLDPDTRAALLGGRQ